jgi:hypothetical protein
VRKKLQITFSVLAGLALIVLVVAVTTNINAPTVPGWVTPVVWACFGLVAVSCLVIVGTLVMELLEKDEEDEDEEDELEEPVVDEEVAEQLAAVGAVSEIHAGEGIDEAADHMETAKNMDLTMDMAEMPSEFDEDMFGDAPDEK